MSAMRKRRYTVVGYYADTDAVFTAWVHAIGPLEAVRAARDGVVGCEDPSQVDEMVVVDVFDGHVESRLDCAGAFFAKDAKGLNGEANA